MVNEDSYSYRWTAIGGHPALDLCNTRSWRLDRDRSIDRIDTTPRFDDWYMTVVLPTVPDGVSPASSEPHRVRSRAVNLPAVHRLRDATIAVLDAHLGGDAAPSAALDIVGREWRRALKYARPSLTLPVRWSSGQDSGRVELDTLSLAVDDLLRREDLYLLRRCDGPGCGWLFMDHTRNHSRRWCDPTDCGNRARVRAYTHRQREKRDKRAHFD